MLKRFFRERWKLLLLLLLVAAALLRLSGIFWAFEYDEIWTLQYFSGKDIKYIFTELALPNNQPLNSLAVKLAVESGMPPMFIRWHSILAGVGAVWLTLLLGLQLGRTRQAGFMSGVFMALAAPAAVYSALARGYELQLFFLLLCANGFAWMGRKKIWPEAAVAAGGAGSILTLSSSPLFLGGIVLSGWLLHKKMPRKSMLGVLFAGVIFCALWYGVNWEQFRSGQQFGTPICSWGGFLQFSADRLAALIPPEWYIPALAALFVLPKRLSIALLLPVAAALLGSVATKGGPDRVYIPLTVCFALLCGIGCAALARRLPEKWRPVWLIFICLLAFSGFYRCEKQWRPPDWYGIFSKCSAEAENTIVVYPGTAGYPIVWNNSPAAIEDCRKRLEFEGADRKLMLFGSGNFLNGVDEKFNEKSLPIPVPGRRDGDRVSFDLTPVAVPRKGDAVLMICRNEIPEVEKMIFQDLRKCGRFLRLNIFMESKGSGGSVNILRGGIIDTPEGADWKNLPESVRVYLITSPRKM